MMTRLLLNTEVIALRLQVSLFLFLHFEAVVV